MGRQNNGQRTTDNPPSGMGRVDPLMLQAVSDGVFPGAVLLVSRDGTPIFHRAYGVADLFSGRAMTVETIFDLASLTKPLATTLAVMHLIQHNRLGLQQPLGELLPAFKDDPKSVITIANLLCHNSGLAAYRPFYQRLEHLPMAERKSVLRDLLAGEPLIDSVGAGVVYSDIGFMILQWVVERISGWRLDHYVREELYRPCGLDHLFFIDLNTPTKPPGVFAATEQCRWRKDVLVGRVHDENTYVLGGVQGHAGLFGTAADVHRLLVELLSAYHDRPSTGCFEPDLVRLFFRRWAGTDRALGFDTPSVENSSSGRFFSTNSVGHLGFTGTSFWMDLDQAVVVILLTNRVHPTRDNEAIRQFRPKLHDAVMKRIKKG